VMSFSSRSRPLLQFMKKVFVIILKHYIKIPTNYIFIMASVCLLVSQFESYLKSINWHQ
jgi:hypothetical protein